ncbi:MAG TPA: LysM peptidoglycan-binding domain-containing protein [Chitinophagaceae bacterium]|nr:LysM peptidoglycan-binding domain-containing protein [Chitinophagaceae bacterium]
MALQDKYRELVTAVESSGVTSLQVREQGGVLYIDGIAPSGDVKQKLWDIYGRLDPDYRAADLVMNIKVTGNGGTKEYEVVRGDNLTKIGKKFGVNWKNIYEANKDKIKDPDHIEPGWKLKIPG